MISPALVFPDAASLAETLAGEILEGLERSRQAGRRYVLGCPGGRSLRPTYRALARQARERDVDLRPLIIAMMDEYVLHEVGGYVSAPVEAHFSCRGFAQREIVEPLDAAVAPPHRLEPGSVWVPSPTDPAAYDMRIADIGGIDLFLLASGSTDGHVAFNAPGAPLDGGTAVVELPESTRADNLRTFPTFASLDEVPRHGVTVGLGTIARHSRRAVLVLHGPEKRMAASRLLATDGVDQAWPASIIHGCRDGRIYLDEAAAQGSVRPAGPELQFRQEERT